MDLYFDFVIGVLIVLLTLMTDSKYASFSVAFIVFIMLDIEVNDSIIAVFVFILFYLVERKSNKCTDSTLKKIIGNNKRLFPFSDDIYIAIYKNPYTYLYLNYNKVVKIRSSLKDILIVNDYLIKVSRNTAISSEVVLIGKDRFKVENMEVTSSVILSWNQYPQKENNS